MQVLCKHEPHKVLSHILAPKWSNDTIRIDVDRLAANIEHYVIQFVEDSPRKKYGWFYMSGKDIAKAPIKPNGRGKVYEVPLSKRQELVIRKDCEHAD